MGKKPIQLTATDKQIYALCEDGSIWRISERLILDVTYPKAEWERLPSIPHWANIYLILGAETIGEPIPDYLKDWNIIVDAMSDEQRYLKCSKYTKQFTQQDYDLLDRYAELPKDWPDNL